MQSAIVDRAGYQEDVFVTEIVDNRRIWSALEKTDPTHTKGFQRAGGFRGTALKPMWVWQRLTEQFGPFGEGWGCDQPQFTTIPANAEILVYCTISAWHGNRDNVLWGVGGDKVIADTKNGPKADDEAFKKAFTDALMNAFKFIGVGADVHMGRFDDNKYVEAVQREFHPPEPEQRKRVPLQGPIKTVAELRNACGEFVRELHACGDSDGLEAFLATDDSKALTDQVQAEKELFWLGDGADFRGLKGEIEDARKRVANDINADSVPY